MAPQKKEEETALQLELINQSIAQLNSDQKLKTRTKIGFVTKEQDNND